MTGTPYEPGRAILSQPERTGVSPSGTDVNLWAARRTTERSQRTGDADWLSTGASVDSDAPRSIKYTSE